MLRDLTDLPLPHSLELDLTSGRPLSPERKQRLGLLLEGVAEPFPDLYDYAGICEAHELWTSEHVGLYLGQQSEMYSPGDIDPALAVIIGQAEPDGPIALDYRVSPPRVVYLGGDGARSYWIELGATYDALLAQLSRDQ